MLATHPDGHVAVAQPAHAWLSGQLALAWVLQQPQVSSAIVGASTVAQLEENAMAVELRLNEADLTAIAACASDE